MLPKNKSIFILFSFLSLLFFFHPFASASDNFNLWITEEVSFNYKPDGNVEATGNVYFNWNPLPNTDYYLFLRDGSGYGYSRSTSGIELIWTFTGLIYCSPCDTKDRFTTAWERGKNELIYNHTWQLKASLFSGEQIFSNIINPAPNPVTDLTRQAPSDKATTVGEPINIANGQMSFSKTDILIPAKGMPLELSRYYNNQDNYQGPFGHGWRSNFDITLSEQTNNSVIETDENNSATIYTKNVDGTYAASSGKYSVLTKNPDGTFVLLRKHGSKLYFDSQGRLKKIQDRNNNFLNISRALNSIITQVTDTSGRSLVFSQDSHGRITQVTDPMGRIFKYEYDSSSNLIKTTDPANNITLYQYDYFHNLIRKTDCLNRTLNFEYDSLNRAYHSWQDENNNAVTLSFDPANKKTTVTDSLGNVTRYEYNDYGLVTKVTDSQNNTQTTAWDANLNKISFTDSASCIYAYTYDSRGNLLVSKDPLNNTTIFTYEPNFDLPETITDARNNIYHFTYDPKGNLLSSKDPNNQTTNFTYDSSGQLTRITDAKGGIGEFEYDGFGNLAKKTNPQGKFTTYAYDTLGRLTMLTDSKANSFTYQYDNLNHLMQITYPDNSTISYTYNYNDLVSIQDNKGTMSFTYDIAGRTKTFINYDNKTISYNYNSEGNLISLTYPDNKVVNYIYDSNNRLKQVTDWLSNVTQYDYDTRSNLASTTSPGLITTYNYDIANRLNKITNYNSNNSAIVSSFEFTLDNVGNRTGIDKFIPLISPFFNLTNTIYSYNSDNQLIAATNQSFAYDDNGNLLTHQNSTAAGNRSFTYNYDNQLIQYAQGTANFNYQYDALGNRIKKTQGSSVTKYIIDPNSSLPNLLCETTSSGFITTYYVYGLGLISKIQGNNAYFYQYDGIGSTVAITDKNGIIKNKYDYDDFGNVATNSTETLSNPFKYCGKYGVMTDVPDLLYMRARYYSPSIGRFINKDPIGLVDGLNIYAYANNNPLNFVDPWGLCKNNPWPMRFMKYYVTVGVGIGFAFINPVAGLAAAVTVGILWDKFVAKSISPASLMGDYISTAVGIGTGYVSGPIGEHISGIVIQEIWGGVVDNGK